MAPEDWKYDGFQRFECKLPGVTITSLARKGYLLNFCGSTTPKQVEFLYGEVYFIGFSYFGKVLLCGGLLRRSP